MADFFSASFAVLEPLAESLLKNSPIQFVSPHFRVRLYLRIASGVQRRQEMI
jgi:hypothetical protein